MTKRKLNVLVACESSATVRDEFRKLGHNAWSCDLLPCDGDPRYHVQGDALYVITHPKACWETGHVGWKWDLMIAHPPCTYLCNSGVRWLFAYDQSGEFRFRYKVLSRWKAMREAVEFFVKLGSADIPHIAIENPIMHGHARKEMGGLRPTQIVQPWMFGHGETKATGLYLKNLPKLVPTDIVAGREGRIHKVPPGPNRWKIRSKTFQGIAAAMAAQWSEFILKQGVTSKKEY